MALTFQFDPNQSHQREPIDGVIDLLAELPATDDIAALSREDEIIPNLPEGEELPEYVLGPNLGHVQDRHNQQHPDAKVPIDSLWFDDGMMLPEVSPASHRCPHFTIEMETGTGKTYVYLRTLYELHQRYGLRKFIIVVPSVAILEGVKQSFAATRDHFMGLYGKTNFSLQEYDGERMGLLRNFASSTYPVVLVMTQQSFNRPTNNFYKQTEKLSGELRPFEWVQATRPVVILDEPQNMAGERAGQAIRTLAPLMVLRYSATHRAGQQPNPIYRLTPIQAFRLGLVKQIEVIGIADLGVVTAQQLRLVEVRRDPIEARVKVLTLDRGKTQEQVIALRHKDDLFRKTKLPEHEGLVVREIRVGKEGKPSAVEFESGLTLTTADKVPGSHLDVWRAQIEKTLEVHFTRQQQLAPLGIKVLSLFFIDRVANYTDDDAPIRRLFDETFEKMKVHDPYFQRFTAADVQRAYFAKSQQKGKEGTYLADEDVKPDSEAARAAFRLIMQGKERLLSFPDGQDDDKRVAFLFAHSALREGWDNPNVFQICTLNQTVSPMKKRQEIGRGLRLCVDQHGRRPDQVGINILTVVANESYESYVSSLQHDYEEEGLTAPPPPGGGGRKTQSKRKDELYRSAAFRAFWKRLCQRLTYHIDIDSETLVTQCADELNRVSFPQPVLTITKGRFILHQYTLSVDKKMGNDVVRVIVHAQTSKEQRQHELTKVKDEKLEIDLKVGVDLGKKLKDPALRGFKVRKIEQRIGEPWVEFENDQEISVSSVYSCTTKSIDRSSEVEQRLAVESHPVPDFITRTAEETGLTRQTLLQIFAALDEGQKKKLFVNPEGWTNLFIETIKECLADHVAERIRYVDEGDSVATEPSDEWFPPSQEQPQRELIEGGPKSLYSLVQIDSDVERNFVNERLRKDEEQILVYFKFPPKFRIKMPVIIGQYNPNWGIVRLSGDGKATLELVRETKGSENLSELRFRNEARKVRLASRYFAQLGIDYRVVTDKTPEYHRARDGWGTVCAEAG